MLAVLGLAVGCGGAGPGGTAHDGGDAALDQIEETLAPDGIPDAGGSADAGDARPEAGGGDGHVADDAMPEAGGADAGDAMPEAGGGDAGDATPEAGGDDGHVADDAMPETRCADPDPGASFYTVFDLNHDGRQDIIQGVPDPLTAGTPDPGSLLQLYRGQADGTFLPTEPPGIPGLPCGLHVDGLFDVHVPPVVGDFDGDGAPDLAVVVEIPNVYAHFLWLVLKSTGGLDFSPEESDGIAGVRGIATIDGTGDFNRDGKLDIVVFAHGSSTFSFPGFVAVALGRGNGTFDATTTVPGTTGASGVSVGDANTDGKLDLTVTLPGAVTVFYGDGAGSFSTTAP